MQEKLELPERKYKIFISSSLHDLKEPRYDLIFETLKAGHIPVAMEFFNPGDKRNTDVIERELADCDIFSIFIGARLGPDISDEDKITYTEQEFEWATNTYKLPIIAFLLHDTEFEMIKKQKQKSLPKLAIHRIHKDILIG